MPFGEAHHRQVLHLHGQPQAQVAFIEVDPEKMICRGTKSICSPCKCDQANENENDSRELLKKNKILEILERCVDEEEDVTDTIKAILIKMA